MNKYDKEFEEDFNHLKYEITSTGVVKRDLIDLLKSKTAQRQVKECKKLFKYLKRK